MYKAGFTDIVTNYSIIDNKKIVRTCPTYVAVSKPMYKELMPS